MSHIAIIGDEPTITGILLAGAGIVEQNGEKNFFLASQATERAEIERMFQEFLKRKDISILMICQFAANKIRDIITDYKDTNIIVLEVPSKDDGLF